VGGTVYKNIVFFVGVNVFVAIEGVEVDMESQMKELS
jgi:hypothetical protein